MLNIVIFCVEIDQDLIHLKIKNLIEKLKIFDSHIYKKLAKRTSKNCVADTLETKTISSMTKDVIRLCLIEIVLLAIRAKWTNNMKDVIFIQLDNIAKLHIDPND